MNALKRYLDASKRLDRKRPKTIVMPNEEGCIGVTVMQDGKLYLYQTQEEQGETVSESGFELEYKQVVELHKYLIELLGE